MNKRLLPAWRLKSSVRHKKTIIKILELILYSLVWLAKIVGSILVVISYVLSAAGFYL
jgi:hypothetical protein